jgi:peptide/nickel transport system substrate-binding protein
VDSAAVKASLERTLSSPAVALSPGLVDIASLETPRSDQLVIRLKRRSSFLLDDLVVSISKPSPDGLPVGTGPYVTDSTSATEVTMKAFASYYRGAPNAHRVVWKSYPAARTSWAAMMRREIDVLFEVSPDAFEFMSDEGSVEKFSFLRGYVHGVVFNMHRAMFRDARVRRALNHAIDRAAIIDQVFNGHGVPASTPTWPDHWASGRNLPNYTYDPARAMALMDEAGLKLDDDRPPARMRFKCIFSTNQLWERMALMVQRNFSQVGVDVQFEELPIAEFNRRLLSGDFDAVLTELIAGYSAGRPYVFWHSGSKQNAAGYRNVQVDSAFDRLRAATDDAETRAAFRDLQLQMLDDPPGVFLAFGQLTRAVSRRFRVTVVPGNDIIRSINEWRLAGQGTGQDSN